MEQKETWRLQGSDGHQGTWTACLSFMSPNGTCWEDRGYYALRVKLESSDIKDHSSTSLSPTWMAWSSQETPWGTDLAGIMHMLGVCWLADFQSWWKGQNKRKTRILETSEHRGLPRVPLGFKCDSGEPSPHCPLKQKKTLSLSNRLFWRHFLLFTTYCLEERPWRRSAHLMSSAALWDHPETSGHCRVCMFSLVSLYLALHNLYVSC